MVLNYIWIAFVLIAVVVGIVKLAFFGDTEVVPAIGLSTYDNAKLAFEISIYLTGVMSLWLGLMKIGERGGAVNVIGKIVGPFFRRIFPEIPNNHPASGHMIMNIAANMIGLDNAATPLGLKAMDSLQELNPNKDVASNAQIMFLVLNTSGLTLLPINIMVFRAQMGAGDPSDVFIPILLATFVSSLVGLLTVAGLQRVNLLDKVVLAYLGAVSLFVVWIVYMFRSLPQDRASTYSSNFSYLVMLLVIISFIGMAARKRVNVYETFIEGAKEGFGTAVNIIPYLVAMLVAIGVFRASGTLDLLINGFSNLVAYMGIDTDFVSAMPTAIIRPLSGSGARAMMIETMSAHGADSFAGRLSSVMQGTTETTFYVLAVYFGAVGIRKTRYAIAAGLIADAAGVMAAIAIAYLFFH